MKQNTLLVADPRNVTTKCLQHVGQDWNEETER